jgi:hypothetical protein
MNEDTGNRDDRWLVKEKKQGQVDRLSFKPNTKLF